MSEQNERDGATCWETGDAATHAWLLRQWAIWPERADQRYTTNLSFLYGAAKAHEAELGTLPPMSKQLAGHVAVLDRMNGGSHE